MKNSAIIPVYDVKDYSDFLSLYKESDIFLRDIDLVSFDIFDTAVVRLLSRPKDLFKVMERQSGIPSFYKNRCLAARLVRDENKKKGILEITLDEIYEQLQRLDSSIDFQKAEELKQMETDLEIRLCQRNKEIGDCFDFLKKNGKKVCFTSDMYLPRETVHRILVKCGYGDYDCLYLSSDDKLTKKGGERFKNFSSPEKVLHIGDNEKSDFLIPSRAGIKAVLYRRKYSPFLSRRLMKKIKRQDDLYLNFASCLARRTDFQSYWFSIGYQYVAPLLSCFCFWLKKEISRSRPQKLCFLARDGMIMRLVWQHLFPQEESLYLFSSRALTTNSDCQKNYIDYLKGIGLDKTDVAVVDVGRKGSIQNNLKKLLPDTKINGYYVDLRSNDSDKRGFYVNGGKKHRRFLDFLDFLFIAPAPLCVGIQRENDKLVPVFLPVDRDEKKRQDIAAEIHQGVAAFVWDAVSFSDIFPPDTSTGTLAETLECLLNFEKNEYRYLENVKIPFGLKNEKSRYLVSPSFSIRKNLLHPLSFFSVWRKSIIKRF